MTISLWMWIPALLLWGGFMACAFGPIIARWPAQTVALLAVLLYVYAVLR